MVTITIEMVSTEGVLKFTAEADTEVEAMQKAKVFIDKACPKDKLVLNHMVEGQKVAAIKTLRHFYGLTLRDAKDLVDKTEAGVQISFPALSPSQAYAFKDFFEFAEII